MSAAISVLIVAVWLLMWPAARAHEAMQAQAGRAPSQGWDEVPA